MVNTVRKYIQEYQLLEENRPVLVGLSGGADSVALIAVLKRLGYSCLAAHCNFHLRGEESDRDEAFVCQLTEQLNVPLVRIDFDTINYAEQNHISIEMAARELRYSWFEEKRKELKAQAIAVAHHQDDSIETLLLNLIRGTGIKGLTGISPKNGSVVRPLLAVNRETIISWLKEQQLEYVDDSTNTDDAYKRNFVRIHLIPLMEKLNPSVRIALARTADHLSEAEVIYDRVIEEAREKIFTESHKMSIGELLKYPSPKTILYELLKPFGFTRIVSNELFLALDRESGRQFYSASYRLVKDREYLLLEAIEKHSLSTYIINVEEGEWRGPIELFFQKIVVDKEFRIEKDKYTAYFDYDQLHFPLTLRLWQTGDWFVPFGMQGRKKLSDYFSDRKLSRIDKEQIWLLCSGENIIWIVGERSDNRFRVDNATKQVLKVKFSL
ncbi:tRNA lysidine(34) synthetase TilS [Parabacteroides sp. PF5-9]|uniref:tRNA lysidine(34) synthetase TilS n=1 Tax=Parabacteroides sp. PF5-9 TaxID=1742404 RepID=UPI00247683D6|nr:tRNA lysidine(34) synthetase TilS [Parabacteroides sp. PF5-9]MDH6358032.1 tRNA(Ile)-lysidine synthase [Parabacteroides sp. PF5-9]